MFFVNDFISSRISISLSEIIYNEKRKKKKTT